MDYSKLSYDEKKEVTWKVRYAISRQDMKALKELFPKAEDLLTFKSMGPYFSVGGSSILHMAFKIERDKKTKGSQFDFLKSIFTEYDLDHQPEIKEKLLLKRDNKGRLAADYLFLFDNKLLKKGVAERFMGQLYVISSEDDRPEYVKDKERMYSFLKQEIKKVVPALNAEQLHSIGKKYAGGLDAQFNSYDKGIPVTSGAYITDDEGNPVAFVGKSIKEVYPEIRLRNIGKDGKEEQGCIVSNLDLDKPLRRQVIEHIDFPEDFYQHFVAIDQFEKAYKKIREDEGAFASIRYFNENRGSLVFEDDVDLLVEVNSKEKRGGYSGYCEWRGDHPYVVLVSGGCNVGETLLHELFHNVDLRKGLVFSETDAVKYAFMLSEMNNKSSGTVKEKMDTVNGFYPPKQFQKEVMAQVMETSNRKEEYKDDPLILRVFEIGEILSRAKLNNLPAVENRIKYALENLPQKGEFESRYETYMKQKEVFYQREKELKETFVGDELKQELEHLENTNKRILEKQNEKFEPKRQKMETTLVGALDNLIGQLHHLEENKQAGQIVIHPDSIGRKIDGKMPEEIFAQLKENLSVDLLNNNLKDFKEKDDDNALLKGVYIARELWNKQFHPRRFPSELDDIMDPEGVDFMKNKQETLKKLELFSDVMTKSPNEFDIRAVIRTGKKFDDLTYFEKLDSYLLDGRRFCLSTTGYRFASDRREQTDILLGKVKESFVKGLEARGYNRDVTKELFAEWEKTNPSGEKDIYNSSGLPFENLKKALPYFGQNYSEKAVKTILKKLNDKKYMEAELVKIPEEERYKPGSLRKKIRHDLAVKLQEMRHDYGHKAKSVSKDRKTVIELRKKMETTK